jgi:hypothetical protein
VAKHQARDSTGLNGRMGETPDGLV